MATVPKTPGPKRKPPTPIRPESISQSAPPLIEQINNGNWLPDEEAEALRSELFYQRAIHAYMFMQPAIDL